MRLLKQIDNKSKQMSIRENEIQEYKDELVHSCFVHFNRRIIKGYAFDDEDDQDNMDHKMADYFCKSE